MSATWIADELRAAGLTVVEAPGWKLRGKQPFTPKVVIAHHTAGPREGDAPSLNLCINGRSASPGVPALPGPLCHVVLSRSGVCHVVASGIANHAGAGSWRDVRGNANALGIEAENTGRGEKWPATQIDAFHACAAVLLRKIGRDETWLCGHKEWTPRKIDPAGLDMDDFRAAVRSYLEDDMGLTAEDKEWLKESLASAVAQQWFHIAEEEQTEKGFGHLNTIVGEVRRNVRRLAKAAGVKFEGADPDVPGAE